MSSGGTLVSGRSAGTQRYWPVIGGESCVSRERSARTAAMLPPAEAPPTMRPWVGEAFREGAFERAQVRASQQSWTPVGKGCSGASLGVLGGVIFRCHNRRQCMLTCNLRLGKHIRDLWRTSCSLDPRPLDRPCSTLLRGTSRRVDFLPLGDL